MLVASQWTPGSSLYGDYWVDRPPLLIDFFDVADHPGGATALGLMSTWDLDATAGQAQSDVHYHLVADVDRHRIHPAN